LAEKAKNHQRPPSFKDYSVQPFYSLPSPEPEGRYHKFLEVILNRRTCRSFSHDPLSVMQLSALLYFTWGCTGVWLKRLGEEALLMKTSPSGGSTHSVEVYPILLNVSGLPSGIYHYSVRNHGLETLLREDPSEWLGKGCGDQEWVNGCGAAFVITALVERFM